MTKQTPLYPEHQKLNARFTEFGGWDMPVQYTTIMEEHNAVRRHAGLFDTSHMGTFIISGKGAADFLNRVTTGDMAAIPPGKARYSLFLNENGGIIDDLIVYRREEDFLLVVNAGNREKDLQWLVSQKPKDVTLEDISSTICLLALQGPGAAKILEPMVRDDIKNLKYYSFLTPTFNSLTAGFAMLARTGYTGEDGFEISISVDAARNLWEALLARGAKPCGLGCRDTLRLEACMPLHGHEISETITPIEAELEWAIHWEKEFIGKAALLEKKKQDRHSFMTAVILESGVPRAHCKFSLKGEKAGEVTSGTFSPTLKKGIALGYIDRPLAIGEKIDIMIHGQPKPARVVKRPFYKRQK
ncbi:MAG: glycine cleavage system aminomethyltransferase GcvT [Endomicrobiales bacterium]